MAWPGSAVGSDGLTQEPEVPDSIPVWPLTFVSPSADSRRAVVSHWQKYWLIMLLRPAAAERDLDLTGLTAQED